MLSEQFNNVPHPDSDPEEDGSMNMFGCGVDYDCKANFHHPMTRAWHISQRHPGQYSGASPDMDIFERMPGIDLGLSKRYLFKKGDPKPVQGVDY